MRVVMVGLRGFPNVQGGVEAHAEHLCPLLVELGCEVHVITRTHRHPRGLGNEWRGVHFHRLWAPDLKGFEAFIHTIFGILYAGFVLRPDILHIQAIGPSIMTPLARLLRLRVVVTHHGPDYNRQKWGGFAKLVLRLGERFGMCMSNGRIVISDVIRKLVLYKYNKECVVIPNGVVLPDLPSTAESLVQFGLMPLKYILLVGRIVPEKRHIDLIEAFRRIHQRDWKLAIVGASDHPDAYMRRVLEISERSPGVVCTGFQGGRVLQELYAHAGLFVLPSSHEGLSIALLEALSYGLPIVASDIPANLEVGLEGEHYYTLGDVDALATKMNEFIARPLTPQSRDLRRAWVIERFNWADIAHQTRDVYRDVVSGPEA